MPSEKEVKDAAREGRNRDAICSVTGTRCSCIGDPRPGCRALQPKLDEVSVEAVRNLRTARLYIEAAKHHIDDVLGEEHLLQRRYPCPEAREIRRKLETAQALIDEIGGDL